MVKSPNTEKKNYKGWTSCPCCGRTDFTYAARERRRRERREGKRIVRRGRF